MYSYLALFATSTVWLMLELSVHLNHGTKLDHSQDSNTQNEVYFMSVLTIILIALLAFFLRNLTFHNQPSVFVFFGTLAMMSGALLRFWAIQTLGNFFKTTVMIQKKHHIIRSGPYAVLRHPSYLGAYIGIIGFALALNNYGSLFIAITMGFYTFWHRIQTEEKVLKKHFGKEFTQYEHQTKKMIPFIW